MRFGGRVKLPKYRPHSSHDQRGGGEDVYHVAFCPRRKGLPCVYVEINKRVEGQKCEVKQIEPKRRVALRMLERPCKMSKGQDYRGHTGGDHAKRCPNS